MKIFSFNARIWWRDNDWKKRMEAMKLMLSMEKPDVICFQEMLFPATNYVPDGYKRVGCLNISHPIYVKKGLKATKHKTSVHWESCVVDKVHVINVHGKWEEKVTKELVSDLNKSLTGNWDVACGDYNVELDRLKAEHISMASVRELNGLEAEDTFQNWTKPESHGEIDHFMICGFLKIPKYRIIKSGYGVARLSDHYPIVMEF